MDADIALILLQDGIINGAVYALLALSLVLVFSVTRVILIPQGELVAFGALTYAALDAGQVPGSIWLLLALGAGALLAGLWAMRHHATKAAVLKLAGCTVVLPALIAGATFFISHRHPGLLVEALMTVLIVAPMAPYLYQIAFTRWPKRLSLFFSSRPSVCTSRSWAWALWSSDQKAFGRPRSRMPSCPSAH